MGPESGLTEPRASGREAPTAVYEVGDSHDCAVADKYFPPLSVSGWGKVGA